MKVNVADLLTDKEKATAIFTRPALGKELSEVDCIETPQKMGLRFLTLKPNMVVPAHVHKLKEKLYVNMGEQSFWVYMDLPDQNGWKWVGPFGQLVVPAGCIHAMKYFPTGYGSQRHCVILVATSSQDATDIQWQEGVDDLLKNAHLKK